MSDDNAQRDTGLESSPEGQTTEGTQSGSVSENSQPQPERQPTAEEVAFNTLSGTAQERFRTILKENKELEERLARQAQLDKQQVEQLHQEPTGTDEVKIAAQKLRELGGMATQEDIANLYWTIRNDQTHSRLENEYAGSDGKPKYDRVEVEDYAKRKGFGNNFLAAYRDMYWDELTDAKVTAKNRTVYTEKPTATPEREKPLTISDFRRKLRDNPAYFDELQRSGKLEAIIQELTQEE